MTRKLRVPVEPLPEERLERIERRVLAERDSDALAAPPPDLRRGARRLVVITALAAGVAAGALVMAWKLHEPAQPAVVAGPGAPPTRVVTPTGGASRLELGDAIVLVGSDTELTVERAGDGAITLRLARGLVDCDVEPRPGRAPFQVLAADVTVTVVGTRFTVERGDTVRVGVLRGKVRVAAPGGEQPVAAGQAWERERGFIAMNDDSRSPPPPAPDPRASVPDDAGVRDVVDAGAAAAELDSAAALEATDAEQAAERYARLARENSPSAEEAAYRLARLQLGRDRWDLTLQATRAYEQRFPRGPHLEEILWFRVEASCGAYKSRDAESAARAYLRRFPTGPHAPQAKDPAICKSISN